MTRLPAPDMTQLSDQQQSVYDAIASGPRGGVRGPLAIWLHRPVLAQRAQALGQYCRYDSCLPARLSELAIIVTARVWQSEYEWQAHKKLALQAGITPQIVEAIRTNQTPEFEHADEAIVYQFAQSLQTDRRVPQQVYDQAVQIIGNDAVVDLTALLGYYALISMTINVFEVAAIDSPHELD